MSHGSLKSLFLSSPPFLLIVSEGIEQYWKLHAPGMKHLFIWKRRSIGRNETEGSKLELGIIPLKNSWVDVLLPLELVLDKPVTYPPGVQFLYRAAFLIGYHPHQIQGRYLLQSKKGMSSSISLYNHRLFYLREWMLHITVSRQRKRSWVLSPETSTRPASSSVRKVCLSAFFFSSGWFSPLQPLTTSRYILLGMIRLLWCEEPPRALVSFRRPGMSERNGDRQWLLQNPREAIVFTSKTMGKLELGSFFLWWGCGDPLSFRETVDRSSQPSQFSMWAVNVTGGSIRPKPI